MPKHNLNIYHSLALLILSFLITVIFCISPGVDSYDRATLKDSIYGKAYKPFVYRYLTPILVRSTVRILPHSLGDIIDKAVQSNAELRSYLIRTKVSGTPETFDQTIVINKEYAVLFFVTFVYLWLFLFGFVLSFKYLCEIFYRVSNGVKYGLLYFALVCLPGFFDYTSYTYDFPILMLFTLGLALLAAGKWAGYLAVFAIGCLNKETTILLTLIYILYYYKVESLQKRSFYLLLSAQAFIFIFIKTALYIAFIDNPGGMVEFHLARSMRIIGTAPLETYIAFAGVALAVFYDWNSKPAFLRKALWIAVPMMILAVPFGYIDEQRDYYELYPIVLLLILPTVGKIVKPEVTTLRNN